MLSIVANSVPEHGPGELTKYHYLTFGWLVEGLVKSVTGDSLRNFVSANIGTQLDIDKEFMIGIPGETGEASSKSSERREEEETLSRVANLVLGRIVMPAAPPKVAAPAVTVTPVKIADTPTPASASAPVPAVVVSTTSPATMNITSASHATTAEVSAVMFRSKQLTLHYPPTLLFISAAVQLHSNTLPLPPSSLLPIIYAFKCGQQQLIS